ncbi:MAG: hypothetical protein QOJ16_114 [Acidobacteriota bacterium]|jgi:hypothetical protein|nr:hypothetical protein [Acidobacteriota bacterium]
MNNPYLELTEELNRGRLRALLSSGQAVVVHRLAIMSKDGDWILREDAEAVGHALEVLSRHEARYRFGAPLDLRWLRGGWSSHLEFRRGPLRLRTDFVTRPPRITPEWLARIWAEAESTGNEVVGLEPLAALKLTNRDKDYAVVGELARLMPDPHTQFLYSRSSRDLIRLAEEYPAALAEAVRQRPLLGRIAEGREILEEALDRERRELMRTNEERLARYQSAAEAWAALWPGVQRQVEGMSLLDAHHVVTSRAEGVLPFGPQGGEA